ncbi:MAG: type IX secretion system outer membrane channel protein PorV [Calditrichaceae bacterium]
MRKFITLSLMILGLLSTSDIVFAQGEAAVPFLQINPGARNGGLGEAGVALAEDATAVYWNPAGLAFQYDNPEVDTKGEISLMHAKWLPQFNFSDLFYDYLAWRYYIEDIGMIGGSITYLNLGENVWTDEAGNELGTFDSYEYAVTLSYATKLKSNLGIGVNAKIIQSNLSDVQVGSENQDGKATAFAVDLGVLWTPGYAIFDNRLRLGANLSNFGPKVSYIDKDQADPLPTNLRLGLAYKIYDDEFNRINFVYDLNRLLVVKHKDGTSDNVFEAAFYSSWVEGDLSDRLKRFTHSVGLEYWYGNLIALRAGYFYEDPNYGDRNYLTFGGGLQYNIFGIDFSYVSAGEEDPLSDTMRFSLAVQF